jgi:hypothetical protein
MGQSHTMVNGTAWEGPEHFATIVELVLPILMRKVFCLKPCQDPKHEHFFAESHSQMRLPQLCWFCKSWAPRNSAPCSSVTCPTLAWPLLQRGVSPDSSRRAVIAHRSRPNKTSSNLSTRDRKCVVLTRPELSARCKLPWIRDRMRYSHKSRGERRCVQY